jgi:hypothetical protein
MAQENLTSNYDSTVINWAQEYLFNKYKNLILSDSSKIKHYKENNIRPNFDDSYYLNIIDVKSYDSVWVYIYCFGMNNEHSSRMLLIRKQYGNRNDFFVIGSDLRLENVIDLFNFCQVYNFLSDSIKVRLYEMFIYDYKVYKDSEIIKVIIPR